jgi:transaldolase
LVTVVPASKVAVAKDASPRELGELFAVAKNAKLGLAGENLFAAKKGALTAHDSEAVVAKEFGRKIRSGLGLHTTKIARPLGGLKPLPRIIAMKFFIDTANLAEIKEAHDMGILDGVTTNPSLMAKEGISGTDNILKHYKAICDIVEGDVSAEVISTDFAGMVREGELLAEIDPKIVVKVPMIKDGVKAIRYFSDRGIKTNCTLVFSAGQALLAAKAGASYVSPFIGRLDDISTDGLGLIETIRTIYDNYGYDTEILAASVRHPMHIIECATIGADVMTGPLSAITALLKHPLTDLGLEKFLEDYRKSNS